MPAKRPAPKSAKAKKAASRPAARKAAPQARKPAAPAGRGCIATCAKRRVSAEEAGPPAQRRCGRSRPECRRSRRARWPPRATWLQAAPPRAGAAPRAAGDDGEALEPGSLLAGPRNVQPYIAKRGEQYMSKEQLEHFRNILNSWKRDLMVEVDRTVSHMKDEAANFPDPNDRATQEEEFSLELRTRDRERKLIRKIDEALKRIEDGSYGYCLETGEEIGIKRLEARPVATLSIEAQERRERRERQYGDRDDRYR